MLYTWIVTSGEETYDGVPVVELPISDVDVPAPTHLRRSLRHAGEADIDPAWAIEAALDQRALIARDPASRTGEAIRVVGFSPGAARVLVVVLLPEGHPLTGSWHVVTAWPANRRLRGAYGATDEEGDMT
jgi:hypothetical protein